MKHIVGFSGGIDSQAVANWVLNRFPKEDVILLNSDAGGNEHPATTEFIAWFSTNVHPVVTVSPTIADNFKTPGYAETRGFRSSDPLTFRQMIEIQGRPPSGGAQFCTEILKLRPSVRWIHENIGANEPDKRIELYIRYTGLRRDESDNRKNTPASENDEFFLCTVHHPIFDWNKPMCFEFCEKVHGQLTNPLYRMGFSRVGCFPCVANWGRDDIRNWAKRYPAGVVEARKWEATSGITFFPPKISGKTRNTVDEVVAWANCERGGKQYSLDVMRPAPVCESKFGLCG